MATRSGKANIIQSVIGSASPCNRLFRNAGPASVWDWGDSIEPIGVPVAFDADCVIRIDAHVYLTADSAYAVSGAFDLAADTSIAATGGIDVSYDHYLRLYHVSHFAKDSDLRSVIQNSSYTLFDGSVGISNAMAMNIDVEAEVTHLLTMQFDLSLQPYAHRSLDTDILIEVPYPVLFSADTSAVITRAISSETGQRIVILGSIDRIADLMQSVWSNIERQMDTCVTVGKWVGFETDQALRIGNTAVLDCDTAWIIECRMSVSFDIQIRTTTRLVPDLDSIQIVYGLIICESHPIEV